jgi:hypothetical protein
MLTMGEHRDNLIALPDLGGEPRKQSCDPEVLRVVIGYLDDLNRQLRGFSPHATWPARRWMIASTPFRMRLVGARNRLGGLGAACPVAGRDAMYWLLELKDASHTAERQFQVIDACLRTLQHGGTEPSVRAREAATFASYALELAEATMRIRNLLLQRFPEVAAGDDE